MESHRLPRVISRLSVVLVTILAFAPDLVSAQAPTMNPRNTIVTQEAIAASKLAGDSTLAEQCANMFVKKSVRDLSYGCRFWFYRFTSPAAVDEYYGGFKVGNSISLQFGSERALYTELASDNLWWSAGVGYLRLGFGALVSSGDEAEGDGADPSALQQADGEGESSAEQFFQSGGNAVMYLSMPVFFYLNMVGDDLSKIDSMTPTRRVDSFLVLTGAFDVPKMSSTAQHSAFNMSLALQTTAKWRTAGEDFQFFLHNNLGYVNGTRDFYRNLTPGDAPDGFPFGFAVVSGTAGVEVMGMLRIGANAGAAFGVGGINYGPRLSIELLPRND